MRTFAAVNSELLGTNAINKFYHFPGIEIPYDFPRINLDTIYSTAVIDTHTGPVQIRLPEADRYMSICCINQDHYVEYYSQAPSIFYLSRETVQSRYILCIIRTADTNGDYSEIEPLQFSVNISSKAVPESFRATMYDLESLAKNRDELKGPFLLLENSHGMFGSETETNTIAHLLAVAGAPLGLPDYAAMYEQSSVEFNDGLHDYVIHVRDVPCNEFWSVTVYTEDGFFFDEYSKSINSYKAEPNDDGSYTINFSNNPLNTNNLNIGENWNYVIRMYEPYQEIIDDLWKFPKPILTTSLM